MSFVRIAANALWVTLAFMGCASAQEVSPPGPYKPVAVKVRRW